mgnify:CR=1 FL=1
MQVARGQLSAALAALAEVDRTDRQDELKVIYRRMFGPPRSRLTRYLQARGDSSGSFVMELLSRHARPVTAEGPVQGAGESVAPPTPPPEPATPLADDGGMPWLAEEDDEESVTTQVHHRSGPRISPTVRLELPVGTPVPLGVASTPTVPESPSVAEDSDEMRAAGPLLEPADDDADERVVTTTLRRGAAAAEKPTPDPHRYPPRPSHLADGVPFQRRRPSREANEPGTSPAAVPPKAGSSSMALEHEPVEPDVAREGSGAGPHQTRPQRTNDTQPDAPPRTRMTKLPRPSEGSTARWVRSAFVTVAAVLLVACSIGLLVLLLAEPEPAVASPHDPYPANMAATGATGATGG